jgi:hypothetical protein
MLTNFAAITFSPYFFVSTRNLAKLGAALNAPGALIHSMPCGIQILAHWRSPPPQDAAGTQRKNNY